MPAPRTVTPQAGQPPAADRPKPDRPAAADRPKPGQPPAAVAVAAVTRPSAARPATPTSGVPAPGPTAGLTAAGLTAAGLTTAAPAAAAPPLAGLTATLEIEDRQLRVAHADARRALEAVAGQDLVAARARLRYGPGRTCEPVARLLDAAAMRAERAGLDPARLLISASAADPGEDIVRVRRKAHGKADWIHSPTVHIQLTLRPAGVHAANLAGAASPAAAAAASDAQPAEPAPESAASPGAGRAEPSHAEPAPDRAAGADGWPTAVREALFDVIDPDLGVNVVDLGFVRDIRAEDRTVIITMTLTSPACPLTGVLEDQIRTSLAGLPDVSGFRVDWVWLPAWRPGDVTDSGREQLQAIGFTIT